jgi:hypothetical protein
MRTLVLLTLLIGGCSKPSTQTSAPSPAPSPSPTPDPDAPACADPSGCLVACESGKPAACFLLGSMYQNGTGVAVDLGRAAEFYGRACTSGYTKACERKTALATAPQPTPVAPAPVAPTTPAKPTAVLPAAHASKDTPAPVATPPANDDLEDQRRKTLQAQEDEARAKAALAQQQLDEANAEQEKKKEEDEQRQSNCTACDTEYKRCTGEIDRSPCNLCDDDSCNECVLMRGQQHHCDNQVDGCKAQFLCSP